MNTFTSRKLIDALNEGQAICQQVNIPIGNIARVTENARFTSTWGRCKKLSGNRFEIEISSRLLADGVSHEALMDTMLHEILHTCKGCFNHGELWKRYAARLNSIGWSIQRCTSCEEKNIERVPKNYKYRVTCEECGDVWHYSRRGGVVSSLQRNPHSCTCHCGSHNFKLDYLM